MSNERMTVENARRLYLAGAGVARGIVFDATRRFENDGWWWPRTQSQASVVSHAMALQWALEIPERERPRWLCMNVGKPRAGLGNTEKSRLIEAAESARPGLAWVKGEAMLDAVVFPDHELVKSGGTPHVALLTFESEMSAVAGVQDNISRRTDDYAWDYFKLIWVPSPRRLFVARVGAAAGVEERDRIDRLTKSLDTITRWYKIAFSSADQLVVVVLAAAEPSASVVKVVIGGDASPGWEPLFPAK